jgi:hypothetical protein
MSFEADHPRANIYHFLPIGYFLRRPAARDFRGIPVSRKRFLSGVIVVL